MEKGYTEWQSFLNFVRVHKEGGRILCKMTPIKPLNINNSAPKGRNY